MSRQKPPIATTFIMLVGVFFMARASSPIMMAPTINLFETGKAPLVSGNPRVTMRTYVKLFDSAGNKVSPLAIWVRGDSLLVARGRLIGGISGTGGTEDAVPAAPTNSVVPIGNPGGTSFRFSKAGIYRAYEAISDLGSYRLLGQFRILPVVETIPAVPMDMTPFSLKLTIEERDFCYHPLYRTSYSVSGNRIRLSYEVIEMTDYACATVVLDPVLFGPKFDIGALPAGQYAVIIEDTVSAGTVSVSKRRVLSGSVYPMQDPNSRMAVRPISGAVVKAVAQQMHFCGIEPATRDTLTTISGTNGRFSFDVPQSALTYRIWAAKKGYHPQTVFAYPDTDRVEILFELLSTAVTPTTGLEVLVTKNGKPLAGVRVDLAAGLWPQPTIFCLPAAKTATPPMPPTVLPVGYTDGNGRIPFSNLALSPYIDYWYVASGPDMVVVQKDWRTVRLNKYGKNVVRLELGTSGITPVADVSLKAGGLRIVQAGGPTVRLVFGGTQVPSRVGLYDISGRLVESIERIDGFGVAIDMKGKGNGMYLLRAKIGEQSIQKRFIRVR